MTAPSGGEHVYATLLLNDSYLPGALVLAHSLRDGGTRKKLAVLVTLDSVNSDAITQLRTVYDYVLPVPRIRNGSPANLYLMNRADLHSAFTKICLWKQTQFSRIVYIDADVVAYRAPDELFTLPHAFAAAPDIGWPDIFNTGVMVLTPDLGEYYALLAMAERGISFDGADQGLLNMYFKNNFHRLSFTYNVTPSAHYQYLPAYRHFQSSINMVHFIGANKPWFAGRHASYGGGAFDEMIGRWWAVYDRHYRARESSSQWSHSSTGQPQHLSSSGFHSPSQPVQSGQPWHAGEHNRGHQDPGVAQWSYQAHLQPPSQQQHPSTHTAHSHGHGQEPGRHYESQHEHHHPNAYENQHQHQHHEYQHPPGEQEVNPATHFAQPAPFGESVNHNSRVDTEAQPEEQTHQHHHGDKSQMESRDELTRTIETHSWDAQRQPPPAYSKPEAENFPSTHYEMSRDVTPFVPPERYPSPPKDMWYEVPKEPPAPPSHPPRHIFPWEGNQNRPSRSFTDDKRHEKVAEAGSLVDPPGEDMNTKNDFLPSIKSSTVGDSTTETTSHEPVTPSTPTINTLHLDPWTSFSRINAWDDVPGIGRYVDGFEKHRRRSFQGGRGGSIAGQGASVRDGVKLRGLRVTDFPSEVERPSLPVTPAPVRRPSFWGQTGDDQTGDGSRPHLPEAEGVPSQAEWVCVHGRLWNPTDCLCDVTDLVLQHKDPTTQLQKLAKHQYEALMRRLGGEEIELLGTTNHEIPSRPLPFGSEDIKSPLHVSQAVSNVLSPQPVKIGASTTTMSLERNMSQVEIAECEVDNSSEVMTPGTTVPTQEPKPCTSNSTTEGNKEGVAESPFQDVGVVAKKEKKAVDA